MIRFVTTRGYEVTLRALTHWPSENGCRFATINYNTLFASRRLPAGTYIFTDHERLSDRELALASEAYRALQSAAPRVRVLNDPARVKTRFALLRALHTAGLNAFDAYPADGLPKPRRFPVFVRSEWDHAKPSTELISSQEELERELAALEQRGVPLRGQLVIEYCAEPVAPGIFQRFGTFRVGDDVLLDHAATEDNWNVKYGKVGLVGDDVYATHDGWVRANAFHEPLRTAFEMSGIEYGRADFGLVGGTPQVYEINTNPTLGNPYRKRHPSALRQATLEFARKRFVESLAKIDLPEIGRTVEISGDALDDYRKERGWRRKAVRRVKSWTYRLKSSDNWHKR